MESSHRVRSARSTARPGQEQEETFLCEKKKSILATKSKRRNGREENERRRRRGRRRKLKTCIHCKSSSAATCEIAMIRRKAGDGDRFSHSSSPRVERHCDIFYFSLSLTLSLSLSLALKRRIDKMSNHVRIKVSLGVLQYKQDRIFQAQRAH